MDIVVAVRIARRATAFAIAEPGVETRRLEGMGVQGDPVAATVTDLGFGGGQEPGSQAGTRSSSLSFLGDVLQDAAEVAKTHDGVYALGHLG